MGAFRYNEEEDALRVELLPKSSEYREELEFSINQYGYNSGIISLVWERIKLEIEIDTDYQSIFTSDIENKLTTVPPNIK